MAQTEAEVNMLIDKGNLRDLLIALAITGAISIGYSLLFAAPTHAFAVIALKPRVPAYVVAIAKSGAVLGIAHPVAGSIWVLPPARVRRFGGRASWPARTDSTQNPHAGQAVLNFLPRRVLVHRHDVAA
jgi:hypothetical protein